MSFHNSGLDVTHNRVTFRNAHYVSLEDGGKHKLNPTQNLPLASTCNKAVLPPGGSVNSFRSWRGVRFPPRPSGIGPSDTGESKILTTRELRLSRLHFGARRLQNFFSYNDLILSNFCLMAELFCECRLLAFASGLQQI